MEKYSFPSFFNCVNILSSKIYTSFNMFANVLARWQHLHIMTYVPILAFVSKTHINFIGLAPLQWLWLFSKCQIRWFVLRDYKNIKFKCHWKKWFQYRNNLVVVVMHDWWFAWRQNNWLVISLRFVLFCFVVEKVVNCNDFERKESALKPSSWVNIGLCRNNFTSYLIKF